MCSLLDGLVALGCNAVNAVKDMGQQVSDPSYNCHEQVGDPSYNCHEQIYWAGVVARAKMLQLPSYGNL